MAQKRCKTCAKWRRSKYPKNWGECSILTVYDCMSQQLYRLETEDNDHCRGVHWKAKSAPKRKKK